MQYREFLDAGYKIFGLHGVTDDGLCGCGHANCAALYKHPVISNWQNVPQWSDEQLEVMEMTGQLDTGYGVLVSGLLVVDVDARNGGVESYERLIENVPAVAGAGLIVETGSGGGSKHLYFSLPSQLALSQHLDDYPGIDFKSSGYVVGPGSAHVSGTPYRAVVGSPDEIDEAPAELVELLKKPDRLRGTVSGNTVDVSYDDLQAMLSSLDSDMEHDAWVKIGMALHHVTQGDGFDLWDAWSSNGEKYPGRDILSHRWHSFGKSTNPATLGTLMHYATQAGWRQSVTFESNTEFDYTPYDDNPLSTDGIDLLRPPGFVGELTAWINAQCRYPREHLAVANALVGMGNVAGLRYTDDRDGVTCNLFAFCVAGSGTGKESSAQALVEIHRAAGIHKATHGSIKSEQEVIRNLIRHQAALYVIDEIGILLQKIKNAIERGGAAYLDGVIGVLMSAYSKANGYMLLTGDAKEEVRKTLQGELRQLNAMLDDHPDKTGSIQRRLEDTERTLESLDNGLENPFLSLIGYTTPVTFDDLVTAEQASNGFIGRALLVNERETNPRAKRRFRKQPMPPKMDMALKALYSGGDYDATHSRVEWRHRRTRIPTSPEADELLDLCLDWFEDHAEEQKSRSGMEAIVRRGYEMVSKISLILGVPGGVREAEHVRWAFALVKRDIEAKISLAYANEHEKDKTKSGRALALRIMSLIDEQTGATLNALDHRLRRHSKADIEKCLDNMHKEGLIHSKDERHPGNGKVFTKWYVVDA